MWALHFFFLSKIIQRNIASICVLSDNKMIIFWGFIRGCQGWDVIRVNFDIRWKFNICLKPQRSHNRPIQIWQGCLISLFWFCLFVYKLFLYFVVVLGIKLNLINEKFKELSIAYTFVFVFVNLHLWFQQFLLQAKYVSTKGHRTIISK